MPESPPIVTTADIAEAMRSSADQMSDRLGSVLSELVRSLRPGATVRDLPADDFQTWQIVIPAGAAVLLVPASEARTRVLLFGSTDVMVGANDGASPTSSMSIPLLGVTAPFEMTHRAAVYASNKHAADAMTVSVYVESARY